MEGFLIIYTGIALWALVTYLWMTKTKGGRKWVKDL